MEHNNGGLVQIIFLFNWVILRFKMIIFQGVHLAKGMHVEKKPWKVD